ncbi:hypothetical protein [Providencia phage PSTRCR_127]|nr:hypothetical protein [Providencia phage PSTRCR_127]QQV89015.1 hypothetical protein [Providencia phage PSTRCR_121]
MQELKTLIDTGIKGNSSTGDILYDGGEKLNINMDSLWNVFGDYRLYDETTHGQGRQTLHATGYYQKHTRRYYLDSPNGVEMGSLHDVDTTDGKLDLKLPSSKFGEGIVIINSNGSLSPDTPLVVTTYGSDIILGHGRTLTLDIPKSRITIWCTRKDQGIGVWEYKVESLFGFQHIAINETVKLDTSVTSINIGNKNTYNSLKFLVHAISQDKSQFKSCEILVGIDHLTNKVYKTEYAVLKNSEDELYDLDFVVDSGLLKANVKSNSGNVSFSIKSTDTIKVGAV